MNKSTWIWPAVIAGSAAAAALLTFADISSPLRPLVLFWFLLVCPGMALVRLIGLRQPLVEWTLGIGLSLVLSMAVPSITLYARAWSPEISLGVLIAISVIGAALQLVQGRARPAPAAV